MTSRLAETKLPIIDAADCLAREIGRRWMAAREGNLMKMNRLIPMLPVKSMPASVDFYCKMLGFGVESRNDDWGWAMLRFDECRLMLDQSINAHPNQPRDPILYLYPDDVAEYHQQIRRNGLAVPDLDVTFYGLTEFRISDPDGNRLWIGQSTSQGASE